MRVVVAIALAASTLGCRQLFGFESAVAGDLPGDAEPLADASACTALGPTCANRDVLRTCETIGELPFDTSCGLGCLDEPAPHCGKLRAAGSGVVVADLDGLAALADVTVSGTIDGDTGTISGGASGFDYHVANNIAIFRFKTLHISGPTALVGSHPIALVADDITVDQVIDARGTCLTTTAGPGGFPGGNANASAAGPGGGEGGDADGGGGGGANGGKGGDAGSQVGATGPSGGAAFGDDTITILLGGGGGGGGNSQTNTGGGGGGGVQLVANIAITINDSGGINAGGCGAHINSCGPCNMGGGGAGGTILLEARQVTVTGPLAVNGGGGGGGNGDGHNASLDRNPALGGTGSGLGGNGAAAAMIDGATAPNSSQRAGGGGGGIGRIRLNTSGDSGLTVDNLQLSPALDDPTTKTTRGRVVVE